MDRWNWQCHPLYLQRHMAGVSNLAPLWPEIWCKISIAKLDSCCRSPASSKAGKSTQGSHRCSWCLDLWCDYSLCHESTRGKSRTSFIMVKRVRIGHLTKQVICPNSQLVFCKMMCYDISHATLQIANKYDSHFFGWGPCINNVNRKYGFLDPPPPLLAAS